ncbi:MAG: hypothetical protein PHW39_02930 [Syntrophomonadaceae bacterium]|jgi:Zn-dependent peptidase ImmA (M78 family)|nr:hypothetical protein [Clostridia bacterium]MDD4562016.1 hypothetical protein [Syntrophomonadaceae bacterium]
MRKGSLIASISDLVSEKEASIILSSLTEYACLCGVDVHELRFVGPIDGYFRWHPGEKPRITLEVNLPIKNKAWVLAHEMGHLFTASEIVADKPNVDLIFGEDKELIAKVEQAAEDWAFSFTIGRIRELRGLGRAPKCATA